MARQFSKRSLQFLFGRSQIHVLQDELGRPWFCADHVCRALEFVDSRDAIAKHVQTGSVETHESFDVNDCLQQVTYINESGLADLIVSSPTVDAAERVAKWVKVDVLPSFQKPSTYVIPDDVVRKAVSSLFVRPTLGAWAKRFHEDFYRNIYRLRGWNWHGRGVNHPQVVALYTNNLIYERIAPGLLQALEKSNPADWRGNRKARHHQFLSEDIGHPALEHHLYAVINLMKAHQHWDSFILVLDRYYPRQGKNLLLPLVDELVHSLPIGD
ncbi:P63C domain-containing protein [Melittangium boletus]|uniref:P63C domain-containing protein n=1 Tax=Melittangium boletus TaxID=83453 RepID=UPI003DA5B63D